MSLQNPSPKKTPRTLIAGGILLLLAIVGVAVYPQVRQLWSSPLGPALALPTHTPSPIPPTLTHPSAAASEAAELASASTQNLTPTPKPTLSAPATATPEPLCGGPPLMFILGVGVDTEDDSYTYGLGDAVRVARVDFVNARLTVVSFPRDLWVEIPGISDHYGITHGKLNQSFLYGGKGMGYYDGPGEGPGLMARTLDQNFSLSVDHYGALNMITFARVVDAVGGIDLYLPSDVDGTAASFKRENMGYFYAGNNHLTGDAALRLSRIRKGTGDFNRQGNQTLVLCALREKLLDSSVLPKIPRIISAFQNSIVTDLSLEQMTQLACLLPQIPREDLIMTSFPDELFSGGMTYSPEMRNYTFTLQADQQKLRDYVSQFIAGEWPTQPKEPTCP